LALRKANRETVRGTLKQRRAPSRVQIADNPVCLVAL